MIFRADGPQNYYLWNFLFGSLDQYNSASNELSTTFWYDFLAEICQKYENAQIWFLGPRAPKIIIFEIFFLDYQSNIILLSMSSQLHYDLIF